ncbi:flagellar export protein FliJ [soil metagenome]
MTQPSALNTLIELAVNETEAAAKRLGIAVRAGDEAQSKLELLLQYREDYATRFQADLAAGLTAMSYRNFQLFLEKLDSAIYGQQQAVFGARQRIEKERNAWQAGERKRMSYGTLADRAHKVAQRKESKLDQKMTDEQAARLSQYKR